MCLCVYGTHNQESESQLLGCGCVCPKKKGPERKHGKTPIPSNFDEFGYKVKAHWERKTMLEFLGLAMNMRLVVSERQRSH